MPGNFSSGFKRSVQNNIYLVNSSACVKALNLETPASRVDAEFARGHLKFSVSPLYTLVLSVSPGLRCTVQFTFSGFRKIL